MRLSSDNARGWFRRMIRDERGVSTVLFTVSASMFLGVAGMAVEGGTWYLERRHGQNTADASAIAGVLALVQHPNNFTQAQTDAASVATTDGYTQGGNTTVTITPGSYGTSFSASASNGGSCSPSCNAVQARIIRNTPKILTSFLMGSGNLQIAEVAVAAIVVNGKGCALSLANMIIGGSTQINGCSLASNSTMLFNGTGSNPITGGSTTSAGACTANGSNNPCGMQFQPPTTDPFASQIANATIPPVSGTSATCENFPTGSLTATQTAALTYESSARMACTGKFGGTKYTGDLAVANGQTVDLAPGTYVFYDASVSVANGGTLTCTGCSIGGAGVTIILTGDSPSNMGSLSIDGTVTLNAACNPTYVQAPATCSNTPSTFAGGAFGGILFYMDKNAPATNGKGNAPVSITASSTIQLNGGLYFPSANVTYIGNSFSTNPGCTELVGKTLNFTGNSTLDISQCGAVGTQIAQITGVQLVQ